MIKYYCDICKKEISYSTLYVTHIAKDNLKYERRLECCLDCIKKIDGYIRGITKYEIR